MIMRLIHPLALLFMYFSAYVEVKVKPTRYKKEAPDSQRDIYLKKISFPIVKFATWAQDVCGYEKFFLRGFI